MSIDSKKAVKRGKHRSIWWEKTFFSPITESRGGAATPRVDRRRRRAAFGAGSAPTTVPGRRVGRRQVGAVGGARAERWAAPGRRGGRRLGWLGGRRQVGVVGSEMAAGWAAPGRRSAGRQGGAVVGTRAAQARAKHRRRRRRKVGVDARGSNCIWEKKRISLPREKTEFDEGQRGRSRLLFFSVTGGEKSAEAGTLFAEKSQKKMQRGKTEENRFG